MKRLVVFLCLAVGLATSDFSQDFGTPEGSTRLIDIRNTTPRGGITLPGQDLKTGAVYIMTNQPENSVITFQRDAVTGALDETGTFPTGGSGDLEIQPGDYSVDVLASQNPLILNENKTLLFSVNAGSNEISVFRAGSGELTLIQLIGSGGVRPISLASRGNLLYVLNEGERANISGFEIGPDGILSRITGSTRSLLSGDLGDPGAIALSEDGTVLIVTEKDTDRINTFTVDEKGIPSEAYDNASSGGTPFGAAFSNGVLFITEAFQNQWGVSGISSYSVPSTAALSVTSPSVRNFQQAISRIVITDDGTTAFVSNTLSESVSSFAIKEGGYSGLRQAVAADVGFHTWPTDIALGSSSRFLYVLQSGTHTVSSWEVGTDGSLKPGGTFGSLPAGAQGIAAR